MWKVTWIDLEITSVCNLKCPQCFREQSRFADGIVNKDHLSLELIKKRINKKTYPDLEIINLCGSVDEPTAHPQFKKIVRYFIEWGVHVHIATNGSLKTADWWADFGKKIKNSYHSVVFAIDGADALSEKYRIGSDYEKVQKNYRAFITAGGKAIWQFIIFPHNEHQKELVKKIAKEEGFEKVRFINSHRK